MIRQNDFGRQWSAIESRVISAVERVGASGWYILGEEVKAFEKGLGEFWGVRYVVGVGNGMDALEIGLRSLGLRSGEKVITTSLSAFATTLAILRAGGVPVFVDVDEIGNIDLHQCRSVLERDRSIRFLMPVHLYGNPLDLDELGALRRDFDLCMVEDCAQAVGATWHEIPVGSVGQVAATSFYPTKNLGALGDGGALLTSDEQIQEKARCLRNYGQSSLYQHSKIGLNSRLDELQAAILRDAMLPNLKQWTETRRETARTYLSHIANPLITLPVAADRANPVWHLFPIRVPADKREQFQAYLLSKNIMTGIHYPRVIPDQPALAGTVHEIAFEPSRARRIALSEVSLPIHPFLQQTEIDLVITTCSEWQPADQAG